MNHRKFREMLEARWEAGCFVCVGLDSEFSKIPQAAFRTGNECAVSVGNTIVAFNFAIVEATREFACAYKLNSGYYVPYGSEGLGALQRTIFDIHDLAVDVPVILDSKRGDTDNTNVGYVEEAFNLFHADAVTVNPYLGGTPLAPFLEMKDKGIIVICRTSNPGADEFQDLMVRMPGNVHHHAPVYQYVANRVATEWNKRGNCAVEVGATCPEELARVRESVGDMPILIPGIGAQGGDLEATVAAGMDSRGKGMIINSSRDIIFASKEADFAGAARRETMRLHGIINQHRTIGAV